MQLFQRPKQLNLNENDVARVNKSFEKEHPRSCYNGGLRKFPRALAGTFLECEGIEAQNEMKDAADRHDLKRMQLFCKMKSVLALERERKMLQIHDQIRILELDLAMLMKKQRSARRRQRCKDPNFQRIKDIEDKIRQNLEIQGF